MASFADSSEYKIIDNVPIENINFEYIRISHLFLCEAFIVLNIIFKFQIIFSLGCCFSTSLLDLYYEFFSNEVVPKTSIDAKVYCWIIQYFARFVSIVIVAHKTTIEVGEYFHKWKPHLPLFFSRKITQNALL